VSLATKVKNSCRTGLHKTKKIYEGKRNRT